MTPAAEAITAGCKDFFSNSSKVGETAPGTNPENVQTIEHGLEYLLPNLFFGFLESRSFTKNLVAIITDVHFCVATK
jgi:hypothetical protein